MRAYILTAPNGPDALQRIEVPAPAVGPEDVLVRVKAISLNPVDVKTSRGKAMWSTLTAHPPAIAGWDIVGEVTQVGDHVQGFAPGDAVFGMVNFPGAGRAYAEYVAAPAAHLAHQPSTVNDKEAVAATLAALTAWQIMEKVGVHAHQRVLIHAAAGGVGHFAVQFAKERKAFVIGTASTPKRDFVLSLGVDEFVDHTQVRFEETVEPVDFVLDVVGGDNPMRSLTVLKPGGRLITIAGGITPELTQAAQAKQIDASAYMVSSSGTDQAAIAERLADGRLIPHVSQTLSFDQLPEALRQVEGGRTQGKIVVTL